MLFRSIYAETCEALARTAPFAGPARVFLGNSGTEVVEAAIKLARKATGRQAIVGFDGGFHGRTYGSLTLTASKAKYHAGFGPLLPGIHHAPFGRVEDLAWFDELLFARIVPPDEVAAIIVEPIQGEGGYRVPEPGFIAGLRAICDAHGILLVADEVQSGAGRTGRMWAIEHEGVEPDVVLTAKGIASGMPLGGLIARAPVLERWGPGAHGSTYGGNPVACAAALASIETMAELDLISKAQAIESIMYERLTQMKAKFHAIGDIRGRGAMIAVELIKPGTMDPNPELTGAVAKGCHAAGVVVLTAGTYGKIGRAHV